jgi:hypothetical protein
VWGATTPLPLGDILPLGDGRCFFCCGRRHADANLLGIVGCGAALDSLQVVLGAGAAARGDTLQWNAVMLNSSVATPHAGCNDAQLSVVARSAGSAILARSRQAAANWLALPTAGSTRYAVTARLAAVDDECTG